MHACGPSGDFCLADAEVCIHCLMPFCEAHRAESHSPADCRNLQDQMCGSFFPEWKAVLVEEVAALSRRLDVLLSIASGKRPLTDHGIFRFVLPTPDGGWTLSKRAVICGEASNG